MQKHEVALEREVAEHLWTSVPSIAVAHLIAIKPVKVSGLPRQEGGVSSGLSVWPAWHHECG